jgi:mannan endo-1,4-beta-mannosidase
MYRPRYCGWLGSLVGILWAMNFLAGAAEPVDPDLIPEARRVLEYLHSVQGKKILTGISGSQDAQPHAVLHMTGREPAIAGGDMAGFHRKWEKMYHQVMQATVDRAIRWWRDKGGLVTLHYHWMKPGNPEGTAWVDRPKGEPRLDLAKAVTPGTKEYQDVMADLKVTADYLEKLAEARVPVLWRPLHEIEGGWFWWTDPETPENTAALWRLMFNYFVKERKLHNLIWVYNAAHISHTRKPPAVNFEEEVAHRKRYYPGAEYVDFASIDTYANPKLGWGAPQEDSRRRAYELMQQIAPGKMLAIGEDAALIDPEIAQKEGTPWVYCLAWWVGGKGNPISWMHTTFHHDYMITLDELPLFHSGNVQPNVWISTPSDGAALQGPEISFTGVAKDRNGNLKTVRFYALAGPWRNWFLREDEELIKDFGSATPLGEAQLGWDGRWTFRWRPARPGMYNLVALAEDSEGAVACSNVIRVTVGLENLARAGKATASSSSPHADPPQAAIDGDPNTMWWSDQSEPDPQWLQVDLGTPHKVGSVAVSWWKAYPKDYTVEVSMDGQTWHTAAAVKDRSNWRGDTDLLHFEPLQARYIRLQCLRPAVNWQDYTLFELGVYEKIEP